MLNQCVQAWRLIPGRVLSNLDLNGHGYTGSNERTLVYLLAGIPLQLPVRQAVQGLK